jgi:hypothetical protein
MWNLICSYICHVGPLIFGVSVKRCGINCDKLARFVVLTAVVMKMRVNWQIFKDISKLLNAFFFMVKLMALKMPTLSSFTISVPLDRSTWYNISERLSIQSYGCDGTG